MSVENSILRNINSLIVKVKSKELVHNPSELTTFISQLNELKESLLQQYQSDAFILETIQGIPDLEFSEIDAEKISKMKIDKYFALFIFIESFFVSDNYYKRHSKCLDNLPLIYSKLGSLQMLVKNNY